MLHGTLTGWTSTVSEASALQLARAKRQIHPPRKITITPNSLICVDGGQLIINYFGVVKFPNCVLRAQSVIGALLGKFTGTRMFLDTHDLFR